MRKLIGTVTIKYDSNNKAKSINFETSINVENVTDMSWLDTNNYTFKNNEEDLKNAGEIILSKFFSHITDIELRDTDKTKIEFELDCKEENGKIVDCKILYYLVDSM